MKKILPILLMIWPYVLILFNSLENETVASIIVSLYLILTVAVYVSNVINAFKYSGDNASYELALFNMLMKIVHIPFYLAVFGIGVLFLFASVVPALLFVTPILILSLVVIDILLLLTSSMYGINAIRKARENDLITTKFATVNTLMHFFFVTDVISSIFVYLRIRKQRKLYRA